MNHSKKLHPFALRAALLSILITSSMALLPALATLGANQVTRDAQALQAATASAPSTQAAS
jgi:hypothetical protein